MSTMTGDWYVSRGGERFGPVSFQDLIDAARTGRLEPRTDLVYGSGLATWTPAGDVDGVFEKKARSEAAAAAGAHVPPSDALADSGSYDFGERPTRLNLPGANRLGYFLGVTALPALLVFGVAALMPQVIPMVPEEYQQYAAYLPLVGFILPWLVALIVTVKRFQNLAMSGWWLLGLLVPLLNYWLSYRLFACPPGYAFTKKLDGVGKFLATLFWLLMVGVPVLALLVLSGALSQYVSAEDLNERLQQLRNLAPELEPTK